MSENNNPGEDLYTDSDHGDPSEDEDLRTALSPSDGYFGTRSLLAPHDNRPVQDPDRLGSHERVASGPRFDHSVPNVMVEDPSLRQDTAEAKAQEAADEASTANAEEGRHSSEPAPETGGSEQEQTSHGIPTPTSPVQTSSTQPHHRPRTVARNLTASPTSYSPYLDAPPPYTPPATTASYGTVTSPLPSQSPIQNEGSGEQQPLLSDFIQPMTPPPPTHEMHTPSWMLPYWAKGSQRVRVKAIFTVIVLLALFVVIVATFSYNGNTIIEYIEEPVTSPRKPQNKELRWELPGHCGSSVRGRVDVGHSLTFDSIGPLSLLQTSDDDFKNSNLKFAHVFGDLILRPATDVFPSGYVLVESLSNTENLGISIHFRLRSGVINIEANRGNLDPNEVEPCLQIRIILYVPPGTHVGDLEVRTEYLNITVEEGFSMTVSDRVALVTFEGNLNTPVRTQGELSAPYRLATPYIAVATYKGRVSGWYPTYEVLSVGAGSKINISSSLKSLRSRSSRDARVVVASDFDDVQVQQLAVPTPKSSIARGHQVAISSGSGDITAELVHASSAELDAADGGMNVTLTTPPGDGCRLWGRKACTLGTTTTWGNQRVVVKRPRSSTDDDQDTGDITSAAADAPDDLLLVATHVALGGDIEARYPGSWEGNIAAVTRSGKLSYTGEGLIKSTDDSVGHRLLGRKGQVQNGILSVRTDTGNQRVAIGG